jgi:hypothetical protein
MTQESKKLSYVDKLRPRASRAKLVEISKIELQNVWAFGQCAGQKQTSDFDSHDVI